MSTDLAVHYLDALHRHPAFEAYTRELDKLYHKHLNRLLALPDGTDPLVTAQHVGVLRGIREAVRLPENLAESQGE